MGAVAERIDYDAWGRVRSDTSPGLVAIGFAGGIYDATTGLVRFGARDYDPSIGRWTTKDLVLLRDGALVECCQGLEDLGRSAGGLT